MRLLGAGCAMGWNHDGYSQPLADGKRVELAGEVADRPRRESSARGVRHVERCGTTDSKWFVRAEEWDLGAIWEVDERAGILRCVEAWHRQAWRMSDWRHRRGRLHSHVGSGFLEKSGAGDKPLQIPC